jgi:hypothetical protein
MFCSILYYTSLYHTSGLYICGRRAGCAKQKILTKLRSPIDYYIHRRFFEILQNCGKVKNFMVLHTILGEKIVDKVENYV